MKKQKWKEEEEAKKNEKGTNQGSRRHKSLESLSPSSWLAPALTDFLF